MFHHYQEFVLGAMLLDVVELISGVNNLGPILQSRTLHMNAQKASVLTKESNQENQLCRIAAISVSEVEKYLN